MQSHWADPNMPFGYVQYPIKKDYEVPLTYAPSDNIFQNRFKLYDQEDRPFAFKPTYQYSKGQGTYDPHFKQVQERYDNLRSSWKHGDYGENVKVKTELDKFIRSTKLKHAIEKDNERMKEELKEPTEAE